jgi:hypothetical protein
MMHRNNVHIDKSHPNASGARLPMTLLLLLTLLVAGAHAQTSIMPRKPLNQTTFLVTTPPAMTPQHACIDVEWPELIRNTVETERTAAMLSSNSNSNSNGGELIHRQRTIRVCSRTNRTVSLQSQFEPGALDLDIPAAMQETETDFRGRVELNGGLATFASFTQVYTSLGDVLFVRLSGLSRANRLIAPAFLFVQTYDTPQIQIVYDSPDGSQTPIVVYNQSDVAARRLVVATLPAGVLAADYNFSTDLFAWERGENVTRLAVVTLIAIDPPPIGQSLLVIYMTKYFEGSSTNGIIIGVIFIFIAACCTPCILIYLFACVALCCCGKERYNRIIKRSFGSIKAGGANVDDEGAPKDDATPGCFSRMFACFERNLALAIVGATIAQGVFTIVQLIALIFNIVLIQQGIEFVTNLVPELQELALQLLDKWAVDLLPLFEGIQKITEAFKLALVSVSINCFSARNILAAALCVWMFQFIVIVIRTDAFVRIRHLVSRVSGPIFETIGGMLLTVLALGMQSTLQQTNLLLGRAFAGETLAFDAVGCTDLDTELLPITRPGTIVFIIAVAIAVTVAFVLPRDKDVWSSLPYSWSFVQKALYMLFGAVRMLLETTLGVWTRWAIKYSSLEKRARSGVKMFNADLGTAYGETMDAVSRLSSMFFILFWPPLIIISKLGEASAEAPIWVADQAVVDLIDPRWQRVIIWTTNLVAFVLQILAVVLPSADALIAAAALIVAREMVLKLILMIVKIVRAEPPTAVGAVGAVGQAGAAAAASGTGTGTGTGTANAQSDMESARYSGVQMSTMTTDASPANDSSSVTVAAAAPAASAPATPAPAPLETAPTPPAPAPAPAAAAAAAPPTPRADDDAAEVASVSAEPDPDPAPANTEVPPPPANEPEESISQ